MRDVNLNKTKIYEGDHEIIKIDNLETFDIEEYDLNDPKEFKKYINRIEKSLCRNSFEYRELIKFLRSNMDMNKCSFYENVNNIDTFKIKIHLHHHPFTLYDICIIVFNKRIFFGEPLDEELIAKEVMYLHYNLLVGLIPLSETVHELVHNNYLFIPLDRVLGKFQEFINLYENYMTPEQLETLKNNIEYSKAYNEAEHKDLLSTHYIYLDVSNSYNIPTYQEVIDIMNEQIKQNNQKPIEFVTHNAFVKCND